MILIRVKIEIHLKNCIRGEHVHFNEGAIVIVLVWYLDLQLPVQSVPITTKVESSSPFVARCTRYRRYVIKIVSDATGRGFLRALRFPPLIKLTAMI